jgi:hypothetical protein
MSPRGTKIPCPKVFWGNFISNVTRALRICFKLYVRVVLPLLVGGAEICAKLHISSTTLRRWETRKVIPFVPLGPDRRYLPADVEAAMRKHRFGPPLASSVSRTDLRERVSAEIIYTWLHKERRTLQRRMAEGPIPYYKIGQTYRFAPDEIIYSLGITTPSPPSPVASMGVSMGGLL